MGLSLEFRKSSTKLHSSSKTAKESSVLPHSKRSSKDADKLKSKSGFGSQSSDLKQKGKLDAEGKIKNSETAERRETERDELVKHMSNLPSYLLRKDRVENYQEKAFNVGVLDWCKLEKWKHKQKHIPVLGSNFTSFNSSESSSRRFETSLPSSGVKPPLLDVKRFECSKCVTKSIGDGKSWTPRVIESFGKTHSDMSPEKERWNCYGKRTLQVNNFASNTRLHWISYLPNESKTGRGDGAKKNMEDLLEHNHTNKWRNHKSSDLGQPSAKSKGASSIYKKTSSSCSKTWKKVDQMQGSDFDVCHKHCHSKTSNIVLLCPQEIPQSSSSDDFQLSDSGTSSDENFSESTKSCLSYVSLPEEVYTENGCSEIPQSGALHSAVEFSCLKTMQHSSSTDLGVDHSSAVFETPSSMINKMSSLRSASACFEKNMLDVKLGDQCDFSKLKESVDHETAELTAQKEMNPSHKRRFSFSLSRIRRSFSFKEGPTVSQHSSMYVSAKSGLVMPQSSVRWDNLSKEKANSHNRNRSSPLWRLLDPILKHKASKKHQSAQSGQMLEGSANSSFKTITANESLLAGKSKGLPVQGILQLTKKNGVPLCKFVLNNERKILAATRNSVASVEKGDSGSCFTFYLVDEIKKKNAGWISHGNKEKNCGYAYNVIAQMKFSSSKLTKTTNQNSNGKCIAKEYVLVGVEIGQADQGQPKFIESAELAAVVIETSCEKSNEGLHDDKNMLKKVCSKCLADERCLCSSQQNDASDSTTVILPGGVHGSPNKGEPTPLIYRWKTGGSCDCGGWDIGCKLLLLSNQKHYSSIPKGYVPYHDSFQLFVQEGAEQDTPLFTLLPMKDGFYSVEFDSTITHLQAFFISVAALSCQKLPGSLEMGSMHEEILKEPSSKYNSKLQGKAPLKYAPMPPLSPVGRV